MIFASDRKYAIKVTRAITIRHSADELFAFWRNLENLARVTKHPVTIKALSPTESHWTASGPFSDDPVEWDAEIINEKPGRLIAWASRDGAEVANAGTVRFEPAPGDLGTEVHVIVEYDPPGGKLGGWLAKLSAEEPGHQVADTLRRFKALMEVGEIPTIDGQPVGEPQRGKKEKKS